MGLPRRSPEFREGPEAASAFQGAMTRILSVSKEELKKREADYLQARSKKKPASKKS